MARPEARVTVPSDRKEAETLEIALTWVPPSYSEAAFEALASLLAALLVAERERDTLRAAIQHVIADSPGTPASVKEYLRRQMGVSPEGKAPETCGRHYAGITCKREPGHAGHHDPMGPFLSPEGEAP
jgi:hypothetical protein